jgi:hypothetical protein
MSNSSYDVRGTLIILALSFNFCLSMTISTRQILCTYY